MEVSDELALSAENKLSNFLHPTYIVHPEIMKLFDRTHPPRVSVEDGTECTVVKVDSANRHGILLDLVQILADLDLIITNSYISSDGGWFMDVFHVTNKHGSKLTDPHLVQYIQQAIRATRGNNMHGQIDYAIARKLKPLPYHTCTQSTAIEFICNDRPGLLHKISSLLLQLMCDIKAAYAWTHKGIVACILYIEDAYIEGPITEPERLSSIEEELEELMDAVFGRDDKRWVSFSVPSSGRMHTERRLHQLMYEGRDYETCLGCHGPCSEMKLYDIGKVEVACFDTHVSIENCEQKQYTIVNIRSRDRPKLLFDAVCVLTDMLYDVFHAAVRTDESIAYQEYFIRNKRGEMLHIEKEGQKLRQCLIAGIGRRLSHDMRLDIFTEDRMEWFRDITEVLNENDLSITRSDLGARGISVVGSFYLTCSSKHDRDVIPKTMEMLKQEIGGTFMMVHMGQDPRYSGDKSHTMVNVGQEPRVSVDETHETQSFRYHQLIVWLGMACFIINSLKYVKKL